MQRLRLRCSDTQIVHLLDTTSLREYVNECLKLCLLMAATDPPVVLYVPGWHYITNKSEVKVVGYESDGVGKEFEENGTTYMYNDKTDKQKSSIDDRKLHTECKATSHEFVEVYVEMEAKTDHSLDIMKDAGKTITHDHQDDDREHVSRKSSLEKLPLNKAQFKEYTKNGDYVDYVVWPVMYLYDGGSQLAKGVAQGSNERYRAESECLWKWWK